MTRTVISIEEELYDRARERAEELGVSFAELVRMLLTENLGDRRQRVDPSIVFNLGGSGGSDVGRDKDKMIGEAVWAEHLRKTGQDRKP